MKDRVLAIVSLAAIVTGGALWLLDEPGWADIVWGLGAAVVLVPLTVETLRSLLEGDVGVDAIALVAIAGALILGEQLAGAIVALMMSGGGALEAWAAGQARRELRLLVERAPRIAHRHGADGVEEVAVEQLAPGDVVVVARARSCPRTASCRVPTRSSTSRRSRASPPRHDRGRRRAAPIAFVGGLSRAARAGVS